MNGVQPIFYSVLASTCAAVVIFLLVALIYFLTFRRRVVSILDPLAYSLLFSTFACSSTLLVAWTGYIKPYYAIHFIVTQLTFILALWYVSPVLKGLDQELFSRTPYIKPPSRSTKYFFLLCLFVNVGAQLGQYLIFGLPIFLESRLIIDAGEAGTNLLSRLIVPTGYIVQILSLIMTIRCQTVWKYLGIFGICFIGLTLLLNGSKSGIISFALMLSLVAYYVQSNSTTNNSRFRKSIYILGLVSVVFTLGIIRIKYAESNSEALFYFLYRMLITGDGLIMGYVDGVIEKFPEYNWFIAIFKGPIKLSGLITAKDIPPPIGFELFWYYNPLMDALLGPNSRHNLIGIRYLGFWGSIPLSFIFGVLVGLTRVPLRFVRGMSPIWFVLTASAVFISSGIETDFYLFWGKLMNMGLVLPPLYTIAWLISRHRRTD